jgi:asparagine N-glycosylation enzyme membrane subunit Stt3
MEPTFAVSVTIVVVETPAVGGVMAFIPTLLVGDYFIL